MTQNETKNSPGLSEKQVVAVLALMRSKSYAEVARLAGVSRSTLYRWLQADLFKAELSKQKNELIERSSLKLAGALEQALDVLIELLKTKNPAIRRLAAGNIFEYCMKANDITDIEKRIKALEDTIIK